MAADNDLTALRQARAAYLREHGLGEDGGYAQTWVKIKLGPVPVWFRNTRGRRATLLQHDLHHIATGYGTTLVGEAEIGAWELASGCRYYYAAWLLNMGAVAIGVLIAPRRVWRAFLQGRRCSNLYHLGIDTRWPDDTVSSLGRRLGLYGPREESRGR